MTESEALKEIIEENNMRINNIKYWINTNSSANYSNCHRNIKKIEITNKALEKQIPKKPIVEYKNTNDCITEIEWKCPICGTNYIESAPYGEWCNYCGQKLDWSDVE